MTALGSGASGRSAACTAQITESSSGWSLTITASRETLDELITAAQPGQLALSPGQLSLSISPNLVPGEPFDVNEIRVVVSDAQRGGIGDEPAGREPVARQV